MGLQTNGAVVCWRPAAFVFCANLSGFAQRLIKPPVWRSKGFGSTARRRLAVRSPSARGFADHFFSVSHFVSQSTHRIWLIGLWLTVYWSAIHIPPLQMLPTMRRLLSKSRKLIRRIAHHTRSGRFSLGCYQRTAAMPQPRLDKFAP